jgi:hypothetical protein
MRPVCSLHRVLHTGKAGTDRSADASIRNSAEQQLSQAADSNFVRLPRSQKAVSMYLPVRHALTAVSPASHNTSPSSAVNSQMKKPPLRSDRPPRWH